MSAMREKPVLRGIFVLLVAATLGVPAQAKYSGGSGTAKDPYRIASKKDLLGLAAETKDYDAHFVLTADIDLSGQTFTQAVIAPATKVGPNQVFLAIPFAGTFDGKGHKVTGLTIEGSLAHRIYLALFGCVAPGGRVKDLCLEDVAVTDGERYIAGLVGLNDGGSIGNCRVAGSVTGDSASSEVGMLAGMNGVGGVVANCHVLAGTTGGAAKVGGLVGTNAPGARITDCDAAGNVTGEVFYIGGLVGLNEGTITHCHATGDLSDNPHAWSELGGLVGMNCGVIIDCHATGDVTALFGTSDALGGLVGRNERYALIADCYATGNVAGGFMDFGGLVGRNAGLITHCHATGNTTGGHCSGGLVGHNMGVIAACYASGGVSTPWEGFLGGGLAGWNDTGGTICDCYATGRVTSMAYGGGLTGANGGTITNCYAAGKVGDTSPHLGGLSGVSYPDGQVVGSFWDVQTSGQNTSEGGTGKTTAQMQTAKTFRDAAWDFTGIWDIDEGRTYPFLRPGLTGDLNGDKKVDLRDFARLAANWSKTCGVAVKGQPPLPQCPLAGDVNWDQKVDEYDLRIMAAQWLDHYTAPAQ
jgi:hypothetical protein